MDRSDDMVPLPLQINVDEKEKKTTRSRTDGGRIWTSRHSNESEWTVNKFTTAFWCVLAKTLTIIFLQKCISDENVKI